MLEREKAAQIGQEVVDILFKHEINGLDGIAILMSIMAIGAQENNLSFPMFRRVIELALDGLEEEWNAIKT